MSMFRKILISIAAVIVSVSILVIEMPAWLVGTIFSHYTSGRLVTRNESGSFWHGNALLVAVSENKKTQEPLIRVSWDLKLGLSKFVSLDLKSYNKQIASIYINKDGANVDNLDALLAINQLTAFTGNLNTLKLSGNMHVNTPNLVIGKKMSGSIQLQLNNIGSGISPINPIGNYNVGFDLSNLSINVNSSGDSVINVSGSGDLKHLQLSARVQEDKKADMLQFMTMMGAPQPDGSYELKVY